MPSQVRLGEIPKNDMFAWRILAKGPKDTCYEEGLFWIKIKFPQDYPFKPLSNRFETKNYSLDVNDKGMDCLDITKDNWPPL